MPNNPQIIKDGSIVNNEWTLITEIDESLSEGAIPEGKVIVTLALWQEHKEALKDRPELGLYLLNDQCVSTVSDELESFAVIAIDFPVFMDGRGFSIARLLRDRYNYQGEVRATGNVIRDQLCYLSRCGFDAFDMEDDIDLNAAVASLTDFTESYQTGTDQKTPLFRRR